MTEFIIPRTGNGEVDWASILNFHEYPLPPETFKLIKAIDANARKEERERCALECERVGPREGPLQLVSNGFATAIRALGDE